MASIVVFGRVGDKAVQEGETGGLLGGLWARSFDVRRPNSVGGLDRMPGFEVCRLEDQGAQLARGIDDDTHVDAKLTDLELDPETSSVPLSLTTRS